MNKMYKAHINEGTNTVQTVKEHSENTARLCAESAVSPLKDVMYTMGLLHDIGKYQNSFQQRIDGKKIRVEHSICGAIEAKKYYPDAVGLMMEYCIAGHHSGIPDGGVHNDTPDMHTLCGRLNRTTEDYSAYQEELSLPPIDRQALISFFMQDCGRDPSLLIDKFAFLTRYCFSCLTDADSLDTAAFCGEHMSGKLKVDFQRCLEKTNRFLDSFECRTNLQKSRSYLQKQVFEKTEQDAEIYLMNMPTGSGKTLCSVKFALERVVRKKKKRIIYVIPYNSIIDQTAEVLEKVFGESAEILRHQSTFSYENADCDEDCRQAAKHASENWDAPFIITTAVQFFESVYVDKRGRLRKLHNMADSILVFDEAHLMPVEYLQPCLRAIAYITKYLNSEAVFLTATMPDFADLMKHYALPESSMLHLITDTTLFAEFRKCRYLYLGEVQEETLLHHAGEYPSSLLIVNRRATARKLYRMCSGRKYHLSTYMTSLDRKRVLQEIREELQYLEEEFPDGRDVPKDRRITIISTSLIEAGVDMDVHTVFRELTGLDSILQAGGRCNREGKRKEAAVYIFELADGGKKTSTDERGNMVKGMLDRYEDLSCQESIAEYYDRLFRMKSEEIQKNTITQECSHIQSVPFQSYAEKFEIIDSKILSLVVSQDEKSAELVEKLRYAGTGVERELQPYSCSLYRWELDELIRQHAASDFGTGIYCLTNPDYYDKDTGILFEATDYLVE